MFLAEQYDAGIVGRESLLAEHGVTARRARPALHLLLLIVGIAVALVAALATAAPAAACVAYGVAGPAAGHFLAKAFGWAP